MATASGGTLVRQRSPLNFADGMGRKKKKSGGASASNAEPNESNETDETPAEIREAPEAIEYDSSRLILDEFHESVEKLPSHGE